MKKHSFELLIIFNNIVHVKWLFDEAPQGFAWMREWAFSLAWMRENWKKIAWMREFKNFAWTWKLMFSLRECVWIHHFSCVNASQYLQNMALFAQRVVKNFSCGASYLDNFFLHKTRAANMRINISSTNDKLHG